LRALYVCYLPLSDPLTETQVLAYLEGLARRGHVIHLLTFEVERRSRRETAALRQRLRSRGIEWHHLRYHKRPSLPATVYDTFAGAAFTAYLVRSHRLQAVHARVHVAAGMALLAHPVAPHELLFDIRGLMAEEYVDAGRWRKGGLPWRLTKWVERRALDRARECVVLTPAARDLLFSDRPTDHVTVIPCCADIERFASGAGQRAAVRARLDLADRTVLVYVGKFGGWYMQREMVEFFAQAREVIPELHFLVLTQDAPAVIEREFERRDLAARSFTITAVSPQEMGATLAAADLAISFIEPKPSKVASSPTKLGEYLAAGLPVVSTAGVGALDQPLLDASAGVLIRDLGSSELRDAAVSVRELIGDPQVGERCRRLAERELSLDEVGIPRYDRAYRSIT
jgi:glycosyltransferase involved in cell wall biosynthesis